MKKLTLITLLSFALLLFCSCLNEPPEEILPEEKENSVFSSEEEPAETEEPSKIFLPLINFFETEKEFIDSAEGIEITGKRSDIPFAVPEGIDENNHSAIKIEIPPELEEAIKEDYPSFDKGNWETLLSYHTSDFSAGIIKAVYVIEGKISTNKAIVCTIENGKIIRINYTNMDMEIDESHEAELLRKVENFENTTTQTKKIFEEGEEFLSEEVHYNYYYNIDKLVYVYQLYFYVGTGSEKVVNNDYGCEYIIE
ncbi:MAG: hypothetical protein IJ945_09620 [Oscillospiraceae bacterium]|nr:hypothetical protein [Oscillospiraceae bacterium]